jgi:hypothetical protein
MRKINSEDRRNECHLSPQIYIDSATNEHIGDGDYRKQGGKPVSYSTREHETQRTSGGKNMVTIDAVILVMGALILILAAFVMGVLITVSLMASRPIRY